MRHADVQRLRPAIRNVSIGFPDGCVVHPKSDSSGAASGVGGHATRTPARPASARPHARPGRPGAPSRAPFAQRDSSAASSTDRTHSGSPGTPGMNVTSSSGRRRMHHERVPLSDRRHVPRFVSERVPALRPGACEARCPPHVCPGTKTSRRKPAPPRRRPSRVRQSSRPLRGAARTGRGDPNSHSRRCARGLAAVRRYVRAHLHHRPSHPCADPDQAHDVVRDALVGRLRVGRRRAGRLDWVQRATCHACTDCSGLDARVRPRLRSHRGERRGSRHAKRRCSPSSPMPPAIPGFVTAACTDHGRRAPGGFVGRGARRRHQPRVATWPGCSARSSRPWPTCSTPTGPTCWRWLPRRCEATVCRISPCPWSSWTPRWRAGATSHSRRRCPRSRDAARDCTRGRSVDARRPLATFSARGDDADHTSHAESVASRAGRAVRGLGRGRRGQLRTGEDDPAVDCLSAPGEGRECVEMARVILGHAERGTPFDRMAVVMRAPELYASHLETALRRAEIPAYFGRGTRRPDPSGRAMLALSRALSKACRRVGSPSTCRWGRCRAARVPGSGSGFATRGRRESGFGLPTGVAAARRG